MGRDSSAVVRQERSNRPEPAAGVATTEFPVPMLRLLLFAESLDPSWDPKVVSDPRSAEYRRLNKRPARFQ